MPVALSTAQTHFRKNLGQANTNEKPAAALWVDLLQQVC
jgi:hypothetical protein